MAPVLDSFSEAGRVRRAGALGAVCHRFAGPSLKFPCPLGIVSDCDESVILIILYLWLQGQEAADLPPSD